MYNVGQIVYCTKSDWQNGNSIKLFNPPKQGQLMVICGTMLHEGRTLLQFNGQPKQVYYPAKYFRPQYCLFADSVLAKLIPEQA